MPGDSAKDMAGKKAQYYVEYLGWRASRGLEGREFTEPIVQELLRRQHSGPLPKLTIQVSKKDIKISREVTEDGKKKKIKTIKYPSIPAGDVCFAIQALDPDTDVVACIYLGFNPKTSSYVHAHVYRFDSPHTARTFATHLQQIINLPENRKRMDKIERDLVSRNAIDLPSSINAVPSVLPGRHPLPRGARHAVGNSGASTGSNERSLPGSDDLDADLVSLKDVMPFDAIADELKHRLNVNAAPILLPPADYDTISRGRGNLEEASKRKTRNPLLVGSLGAADVPDESQETETEINHSERTERENFPNESFYLYPPRSPRVSRSGSEPTSPNNNIYREAQNSPRIQRNGLVPKHGRQLSSSSSHSHHSTGSGNAPFNGDSRERLSGYSNSSNSYRDLSSMNEPKIDYRESNSRDDILLRSSGPYGRGPSMGNSMPSDLLRREMENVDHRHSEEVHLRNIGEFHRQPQMTKSMPSEILRREIVADREYSPRLIGHQVAYDGRFSPRQPSSPQPGDFGIRKFNSLYR